MTILLVNKLGELDDNHQVSSAETYVTERQSHVQFDDTTQCVAEVALSCQLEESFHFSMIRFI